MDDMLRAVEQGGFAFLAHPIDSRSPNGAGPNIMPYADVSLEQAWRSKAILGLQLWNENSLAHAAPARGAPIVDASGPPETYRETAMTFTYQLPFRVFQEGRVWHPAWQNPDCKHLEPEERREREVLLSALGALETQVAPLRDRITADLPRARAFPGFAGIQERHRRAAEIVARITHLDDESLARLQQADAERRAAAQSLETGEATLAAYRRVLQQPPQSAGLFTQRG